MVSLSLYIYIYIAKRINHLLANFSTTSADAAEAAPTVCSHSCVPIATRFAPLSRLTRAVARHCWTVYSIRSVCAAWEERYDHLLATFIIYWFHSRNLIFLYYLGQRKERHRWWHHHRRFGCLVLSVLYGHSDQERVLLGLGHITININFKRTTSTTTTTTINNNCFIK